MCIDGINFFSGLINYSFGYLRFTETEDQKNRRDKVGEIFPVFPVNIWEKGHNYQKLFPAIRLYLCLLKESKQRMPLLSGLGHQFSLEDLFLLNAKTYFWIKPVL